MSFEHIKQWILPDPTMPLEDQIIPLMRNALVIVWLFFYLCGVGKYHYLLFIISLLFILIMYCIKYYHARIQRDTMIEGYCSINPDRITR